MIYTSKNRNIPDGRQKINRKITKKSLKKSKVFIDKKSGICYPTQEIS